MVKVKGTIRAKENIYNKWIKQRDGQKIVKVSIEKGALLTINGFIDIEKSAIDIYPNVYLQILKPLPKAEKNIKPFFEFDVIKTTQVPTFAIQVKKRRFFFNPFFWAKLNTFQLAFVTGHEIGHIFYNTEEKADLFGQWFALTRFIDPRLIKYEEILKDKKRVKKLYQNIII
jgi:hypothetical protein